MVMHHSGLSYLGGILYTIHPNPVNSTINIIYYMHTSQLQCYNWKLELTLDALIGGLQITLQVFWAALSAFQDIVNIEITGCFSWTVHVGQLYHISRTTQVTVLFLHTPAEMHAPVEWWCHNNDVPTVTWCLEVVIVAITLQVCHSEKNNLL